jgi:hypothetical protein
MSKHLYSTTVEVEVDVDIDTDDLTDDDIRELCEARNIALNTGLIEELYTMFKLKQHDAILERVRRVVQDAKGVVL